MEALLVIDESPAGLIECILDMADRPDIAFAQGRVGCIAIDALYKFGNPDIGVGDDAMRAFGGIEPGLYIGQSEGFGDV